MLAMDHVHVFHKVRALSDTAETEEMSNTRRQSSVREILHKIVQPGLVPLRFIGYFPHSFSNNYEISSNFCSVPFFWSLFILLVLLSGTSILYRQQGEIMKAVDASTIIERFCKLMLAWTFMLAASTLGLKGLLSIKATKKFWG